MYVCMYVYACIYLPICPNFPIWPADNRSYSQLGVHMRFMRGAVFKDIVMAGGTRKAVEPWTIPTPRPPGTKEGDGIFKSLGREWVSSRSCLYRRRQPVVWSGGEDRAEGERQPGRAAGNIYFLLFCALSDILPEAPIGLTL